MNSRLRREICRSIVLVLAIAGLNARAAAFEVWMGDEDLRAAFAGREIAGHYDDGARFRETFRPDGSVHYEDELRTSGGHWSITAGTLCTIYDDNPSGGCFRVRRVGSNCFEFHFVARTEDDAGRAPGKPDWTARGWLADEFSNCPDPESV